MMLGDAFYGTYFLLAQLQSRQVDALFEQHGARKRSTDFSQGDKLGSRDHWITLTKPCQSALMADVLPRTLSFKHTLQLWLGWSGNRKPTDDQDFVTGLLLLVGEQSVGNRPGRIEPRAIKRRPKPYSLLTKTRQEAREGIKKYGHPKTLK